MQIARCLSTSPPSLPHPPPHSSQKHTPSGIIELKEIRQVTDLNGEGIFQASHTSIPAAVATPTVGGARAQHVLFK